MNFNQTPTHIGRAAKFTRTYSSSLCRSPTRWTTLSQFLRLFFFCHLCSSGWPAAGLHRASVWWRASLFKIFFSSELPPPRLASVSARKFLELSACLIHAGASCINQNCLCQSLLFLFLFLRRPGAEAGNVTGQVEFWSETRLQTNSLWGFEGPTRQSELLSRLLLTEQQAVDDAVLPQSCTDK